MSKKRTPVKWPTVGVIALGCPKNVVDTEAMLGQLTGQGYAVTSDPSQADLLIVNTCGFIAEAEAESRQAIAELEVIKARHPGKKLVVTGCLAQRYGKTLLEQHPHIDLLLGTDQYDQLDNWLKQPEAATGEVDQIKPPGSTFARIGPRLLTTPSHYAYVKIAEGCNNPCSFCIIPQLRGPYRSRRPEEIIAEITELAKHGVREVILVSQDTTLYGRDLTDPIDLGELLDRLQPIPGITWIRLLYLYPALLSKSRYETWSNCPKIVPYLDLPLQHVSSTVLNRMRRAEKKDSILKLLERIRHHLPEAAIRATFMVGFPGETEAEFRELQDLVGNEWFDHLGIFPYSDEAGSTAQLLPGKIPGEVASQRRDQLMKQQKAISRNKLQQRIGKTMAVMVDGPAADSRSYLGRWAGQAPEIDGHVAFRSKKKPEPGQLVSVSITRTEDYDLFGKMVD